MSQPDEVAAQPEDEAPAAEQAAGDTSDESTEAAPSASED